MSVPWDDPFDKMLRNALPLLPADSPLEPGTRLRDLGMTSIASIDLLLRLEEHYAVSFPDKALTSETFATLGSLWGVLSGLRDAEQGAAG
jgi:diaminopimelate decarboxylase